MLVNVAENPGAKWRVLALAAHHKSLPDLNQLADDSDLAAMRAANGIHVDALVGDVGEDEISEALLNGTYNVFHAAVHGDQEGVALTTEFLPAGQLGKLLAVHGVMVANLLACQSGSYGEQVAQQGVGFVVSARCDLPNDTAEQYSRLFYRRLVRNNDPADAFRYATLLLPEPERQKLVIAIAGVQPMTVEERLERMETKMDLHFARSDALAKLVDDRTNRIEQRLRSVSGIFSELVGLLRPFLEEGRR